MSSHELRSPSWSFSRDGELSFTSCRGKDTAPDEKLGAHVSLWPHEVSLILRAHEISWQPRGKLVMATTKAHDGTLPGARDNSWWPQSQLMMKSLGS